MAVTTSSQRKRGLLWHDALIIAASLVFTWWLVHSGAVQTLLAATGHVAAIGSFVAGFFFTSIFTFAPAVAVLAKLVQTHSILQVALLGAVGTLLGELILFRFVQDHLLEDIELAAGSMIRLRHTLHILRYSPLRWLMVCLGVIIIVSPLPDEPAFVLMGIAKMPTRYFIPLMFAMNFVGILIIGAVAKGL